MGSFLRNQVHLGVNISGSSIEVFRGASGIGNHNMYERIRVAESFMTPDTVVPASVLADLLMRVLTKGIPQYSDIFSSRLVFKSELLAYLSIAESSVYVAHFDQPIGDDKRAFEDRVIAHARKLIPYALDQIYWDYELRKMPEDSTSVPHVRVVFVAVKRAIIDVIIEAFALARVSLLSIENEATSIERVFRPVMSKDVTMVIDLGVVESDVLVFLEGGVPLVTSTVRFGGQDISAYVAQVQGITSEEAEMYKRDYELFSGAGADQDLLKPLITEIQNVIAYLQGQRQGRVSQVYVLGGPALTPGLVEYIAQQIDIPTHLIDLFEQKDSREVSALYAPAFGAQLRSGRWDSINLLRDKKDEAQLVAKWQRISG